MPILKNTVSSQSGRLSSDRVFEEEKKNGKRIGPGLLAGPIVHRPRGWPTCARDGNRVVIGFIAIIVALVQIRGNVISPGPPGQTITFSCPVLLHPSVGKRGCTRIGDFSGGSRGAFLNTHIYRAHKAFHPDIGGCVTRFITFLYSLPRTIFRNLISRSSTGIYFVISVRNEMTQIRILRFLFSTSDSFNEVEIFCREDSTECEAGRGASREESRRVNGRKTEGRNTKNRWRRRGRESILFTRTVDAAGTRDKHRRINYARCVGQKNGALYSIIIVSPRVYRCFRDNRGSPRVLTGRSTGKERKRERERSESAPRPFEMWTWLEGKTKRVERSGWRRAI